MTKQSERMAEHVLADEGVFAGHHGLRGLAECNYFWEQQPYGTRLYYGGGGADYLHRSILQSAISALDKFAKLSSPPALPAEVSTLVQRLRWHAEAFESAPDSAAYCAKIVDLRAAAALIEKLAARVEGE